MLLNCISGKILYTYLENVSFKRKEMISMNRDYKKKQLRRQIINTENRASPDRNKDDNVTVRRWYKKPLAKNVCGNRVVGFRGISEGNLVGYKIFGSNVLKVTRDGVSYIDDKGKTFG